MYVYVHVHVHVHVYVYVHMHVHAHVYVYVYAYTHMRMYTYMYMRIPAASFERVCDLTAKNPQAQPHWLGHARHGLPPSWSRRLLGLRARSKGSRPLSDKQGFQGSGCVSLSCG